MIDIDDTILWCVKTPCGRCSRTTYELASVNREEIRLINERYGAGDTIILWTGRSWDQYRLTVDMLRRVGVHYHELLMGKPQGTYIDRDAKHSLKEVS